MIQLGYIETGVSSHSEVVMVLLSLLNHIDQDDIEKCVQILYESEKSEVLFTLASLLTQGDYLPEKYEFLILTMFTDAIRRHELHYALRVLISYKELVMRNDKIVLVPLL